MFDALVEYIEGAAPEEITALLLEDVALCEAMRISWGGEPTHRRDCEILEKGIQHWLAGEHVFGEPSEGLRQQPLLRDLVSHLDARALDTFSRDELELLCAVYALTEQASHPEPFKRLHDLLHPHMEMLRVLREGLAAAPGLLGLGTRLHIVASKDIEAAKPRDIRLLAGIGLPSRGPVLSFTGDIRVLDCVPDGCTVVAEQGGCYVNGFVLGRVVARTRCEVRHNVSGVVVVTQGDIRARNLINKAVVIAKAGSVHCRKAQDAKLVFAGKELRIDESLTFGSYLAPRILVEGDVTGGELHVSELASGRCFSVATSRGLSVILRQELNCSDYGEELGREARQLMARRTRAKQRLDALVRMADMVEQEGEHFANSAVLFLCGGENTKRLLEEIESLQRRLAFLDRVIAGLQAISGTAKDRLVELAGGLAEEIGMGLDVNEAIDAIEQELNAIQAEGDGIDDDLSRAWGEMRDIGRNLRRDGVDAKVTSLALTRLRHKESAWLLERADVVASIESKQRELRRLVGALDMLDQSGAGLSRTQLLRQMLTRAKDRPGQDSFSIRIDSPFTRLMVRMVNSRLERLRFYRNSAITTQREVELLDEQLKTQFKIVLRDAAARQGAARITGRFGPGVRITTDRVLLLETEAPQGSVMVTEDTANETVTYIRRNHHIEVEKG